MRDRVLAWGSVVGGLYVLTAVLVQSLGVPVLPLFDGIAPPQPYRWVNPPPEVAAGNEPPLPGVGEVQLKGPAMNFFVTTEEGQAALAGLSDSWARQPRQKSVEVTLTPIDPQVLGDPLPGLVFDGNAYRIEARYLPSKEEAVLESKVQVILRYPRRSNVVLKATNTGWKRLESFVIRPSLQVYTEVEELGTFAAAGPPSGVHRRSLLPWIASGAAGVAVAGAGVAFYMRRRSKARKRRPRTRRPPPPRRKRR